MFILIMHYFSSFIVHYSLLVFKAWGSIFNDVNFCIRVSGSKSDASSNLVFSDLTLFKKPKGSSSLSTGESSHDLTRFWLQIEHQIVCLIEVQIQIHQRFDTQISTEFFQIVITLYQLNYYTIFNYSSFSWFRSSFSFSLISFLISDVENLHHSRGWRLSLDR